MVDQSLKELKPLGKAMTFMKGNRDAIKNAMKNLRTAMTIADIQLAFGEILWNEFAEGRLVLTDEQVDKIIERAEERRKGRLPH